MADGLQEMIEAQLSLQRRLIPFWRRLSEATGLDAESLYLKENCLMLAREAMEAMDHTNWKTHRTSFGRSMSAEQRRLFLEETVDCLTFVLNMFIFAGVTSADEVRRLFMEKNAVNHRRQDSGY